MRMVYFSRDGGPNMSRDFKVSALTAIIVIAVIALTLPQMYRRDVPAIAHNYNVELAGSVAPELETVVRADPKFAEVHVSSRTGGNGALTLMGSVENETEYLRLLK